MVAWTSFLRLHVSLTPLYYGCAAFAKRAAQKKHAEGVFFQVLDRSHALRYGSVRFWVAG